MSSLVNSSSIKFNETLLTHTLFGKLMSVFLYSTAIFLTSAGNIVVIIVFATGRRSNTDIKTYLINLSVADLLIGIFCLPFTFTQIYLREWPFPAFLCTIVMYIQLVSVTGSVITNMAIGVDRLWVVKYPLRSRVTKSRNRVVILAIWIISLTLSVVQLIIGRIDHGMCVEKWPETRYQHGYTIFITLLTFVGPLAILTYTYTVVALNLWRRNLPGIVDEVRDYQQMRSKVRVIKMLTVIVVLFGVCWFPLHLYFFLVDFGPLGNIKNVVINDVMFTTSHWLAMANSFVNPIIYGFMNDSFRKDLRDLIGRCFPCCITRLPPSTRSTIVRHDTKPKASSAHNGLQISAQTTLVTAVMISRQSIKADQPLLPDNVPASKRDGSKGSLTPKSSLERKSEEKHNLAPEIPSHRRTDSGRVISQYVTQV